jgi:hypothetical protein
MVGCKKGVDKELVGERQSAKDGLTEIQPIYKPVVDGSTSGALHSYSHKIPCMNDLQ